MTPLNALQAGVAHAFGSDWPVVAADAIQAMWTAVNMPDIDGSGKPGLGHSVSVEHAMQAHTSGAAFALGMEQEVGMLRQGWTLISLSSASAEPAHSIVADMQARHARRLCAAKQQPARSIEKRNCTPAYCSEGHLLMAAVCMAAV